MYYDFISNRLDTKNCSSLIAGKLKESQVIKREVKKIIKKMRTSKSYKQVYYGSDTNGLSFLLKEYEELKLIGNLVDRIDLLRVENGFTIYELALKSDLSINTIKYLYKKKSFPNISTLYNIWEAFEIPIWSLFYEENESMALSKKKLLLISNYDKLSETSKRLLIEISDNLK